MKKQSCCVVFGGAGFIGIHFAKYLLKNMLFERVYLADIKELSQKQTSELEEFLKKKNINIVQCDVRNPEIFNKLPSKAGLIANFAAVHREPGYEDCEYFDTNLRGAENVCKWADDIGCDSIIFTSSIAPYGPTEESKDENSLPVPVTAYGSSKLVAEKIHIAWQHKDINNRRLVIVRPGVVFGPGEGGNVSRMVKAIIHRYFFYMGNNKTIKAGIYVKELCNAMIWVLKQQEENNERISLFNMSMNPAPTIREYANEICLIAGIKRFIPYLPYSILYPISFVIVAISSILHIHQPINPVRIKKLVLSNNIIPQYLEKHGYQYQYTFHEALADWYSESPDEWT